MSRPQINLVLSRLYPPTDTDADPEETSESTISKTTTTTNHNVNHDDPPPTRYVYNKNLTGDTTTNDNTTSNDSETPTEFNITPEASKLLSKIISQTSTSLSSTFSPSTPITSTHPNFLSIPPPQKNAITHHLENSSIKTLLKRIDGRKTNVKKVSKRRREDDEELERLKEEQRRLLGKKGGMEFSVV